MFPQEIVDAALAHVVGGAVEWAIGGVSGRGPGGAPKADAGSGEHLPRWNLEASGRASRRLEQHRGRTRNTSACCPVGGQLHCQKLTGRPPMIAGYPVRVVRSWVDGWCEALADGYNASDPDRRILTQSGASLPTVGLSRRLVGVDDVLRSRSLRRVTSVRPRRRYPGGRATPT